MICMPRGWRSARPPGRSSRTGCASSASPLRSGCDAHPAGPRHADEVHTAALRHARSLPPRCSHSAPNVWPRNAVRGDNGAVSIGESPSPTSQRSSARPSSSSTRTTSGRAAARSPRPSVAVSHVRYTARKRSCARRWRAGWTRKGWRWMSAVAVSSPSHCTPSFLPTESPSGNDEVRRRADAAWRASDAWL